MPETRWSESRAARAVLSLVVGAGLFALGVVVGARYVALPEEGREPTDEGVQVAPTSPFPEARPLPDVPPAPEAAPIGEAVEIRDPSDARIALVIDDLGRSVGDVEALEALGVPLTYAVLPFEVRTDEVVAEIHRRGGELMCHLPMEPQSAANPGPGALTTSMTAADLARATRAALEAVPGATGVNNHMGSSLSADRAAMTPILEVVAERGLFYLDSRTSAASVGYTVALERGIPAAERQVFLDTELSAEAIEEQFDRLLWLARDRGQAVAIGHPHELTLSVLSRRVPLALAEGFEFVPVSYLLDRAAPPE